jgi:hypothetical protein
MINLTCALKGTKTDEDGETTITFIVPSQYQQEAAQVSTLTRKVLDLTITPEIKTPIQQKPIKINNQYSLNGEWGLEEINAT